MTLECTYNTDLFDDQLMLLRVQEFVELMKSIAANPEKKLAYLNMLTEEEKQFVFVKNKGNSTLYPNVCIHELFEKCASTTPSKIAIEYDSKKYTYHELDTHANQLASYLIKQDVGPDVMVAVFMERSIDMIVAILGILKAGGAYVPIDISYPSDRISYLISDSNAPIVITQKNLAGNIENGSADVICFEDFNASKDQFSNLKPHVTVTPGNACYVIYTSGSTGKPKGVIVEHHTVVNYISWCNDYYFGTSPIGNFGLYSSLSFDLTVTSIFSTLTRSKTLTVFNQYDEIPDILKSTFTSNNVVDVIKMTPAHILLIENFGIKTSKIKKAIVGGEELTTRQVEILHAINPDMEIVNEYGPTEATVGCVIKDVVLPADALTIGKPIDNAEIYILDPNYQPLPPGIPGRLFIAGGGLARGYHHREDLTDEKFQILTLAGESIRTYDSGDLARFRLNGEIDFLGRIDNQVKVRGYRIELGEIESELMSQPSVKEQIVVAREDVPGDKKLVAYIVLNPGHQEDVNAIKDGLKNNLPDYMIPSVYIFLDQLPLTVNGKIDHKALPVPGKVNHSELFVYEEPKTSLEEVLANIWCSVLGVEKVGRKDNFFELGGHSILGVKMFNEVEKQLGVKIQLSVIFRSSTIEELARLINKEESSKPWSCLVPLQNKGSKPPLFCIHMHNGNVHRWRVLVKHLGTDQPVYAIQPRGLDDKQTPHTTIEEMADYYIDVMKEVQPEGPYNLIGLCFSGMVVFEMAAKLQERGEQVAFLGMVNNYAPPENPTIYKVKNELNKFMKMEIGDKFNYAVEKNRNLGKKLFFKAKK
ncbi:MAG: enterobactin synthase subunit F [Bacteroidetes bacterium]|nr:enterobactin synthase subunit F [Bacteroidota bacterium]